MPGKYLGPAALVQGSAVWIWKCPCMYRYGRENGGRRARKNDKYIGETRGEARFGAAKIDSTNMC